VLRKDDFTMKKLMAVLIIGGLLGFTTGCPQATTSQTKKGDTPKAGTTEQMKEMKSRKDTGKSETKPGGEMKKEEKKEEIKPSGEKKEEKKEETKKK
jgi:hypothetical protein